MFTLLALASAAVWGTSDFVAGLASRRLSPMVLVLWMQVVGVVVMSLVLLGTGVPWPGPHWAAWALAGGLCNALALASLYAALAIGPMGVVAPLASLAAVVPILVGLVLGESPGTVVLGGMLVALVGVVLASGPELRGGSPRGVGLAGLAALLFGANYVLVDRAAGFSTLYTLWAGRAAGVVVLLVVLLLAGRGRRRPGTFARLLPPRASGWTVAFVGLADLLALGLFTVATTHGFVSVASVLSSLFPVVTAILARIVLDERLTRVQVAGVGCCMVGVALIAG